MARKERRLVAAVLWCVMAAAAVIEAKPLSTPYVAHRSSPFAQENARHVSWGRRRDSSATRSRSVRAYSPAVGPNAQCPLAFQIDATHAHQHRPSAGGIHSPPVLYPLSGPGVSLLYTTDYEHLDVITPASSSDHAEFPVLLPTSVYTHTSPLLHDVDGDGTPEAVLVDYDGGLLFLDLFDATATRRGHVPRLCVRKHWTNDTAQHDQFHSYFEYGTEWSHNAGPRAASLLEQTADKQPPSLLVETNTNGRTATQPDPLRDNNHDSSRRRLSQDAVTDSTTTHTQQQNTTDTNNVPDLAATTNGRATHEDGHYYFNQEEEVGKGIEDDVWSEGNHNWGDDMVAPTTHDSEDRDYDHYHYNDYYPPTDFYSDSNYIRLPPHILATPIYVEIPKRWNKDPNDRFAMEEFIIFAVSYYMDEDEYSAGLYNKIQRFVHDDGGDETEILRSQYVASAIVFYDVEAKRFSSQTHLDLSTDVTAPPPPNTTTNVYNSTIQEMGAFAIASPTAADLDGDETMEVIIGTSMGLVYVLDVPNGHSRKGFPVQMKHAVEQSAVVEDVVGDANLELFVVDRGGNVVCLDHEGTTLWHRDLNAEKTVSNSSKDDGDWEIQGTSAMSLGDVNGDGNLDIVVTVRVVFSRTGETKMRIYSLEAATGNDLDCFPIEIVREESVHEMRSIPQPLLVDLHASQSAWLTHLRQKNRTDKITQTKNDMPNLKPPPHGGFGQGLHIVQPIDSNLYIVEGGTGCIQTIHIGEEVSAMVQVDDVHGTGALDMVVTTVSGQVLLLEVSDMVPYHPLNVWNTGAVHSNAQGYSASSGIFVHAHSRQYRDVLGIHVPITFEIFDTRFNIAAGEEEPPQKRKQYRVEIRHGTSSKRVLFRGLYTEPGIYSEQFFIPHGTGYYTLTVRLRTTHGLIYEDVFRLGYNVYAKEGLTWMVILPLLLSAVPLFWYKRRSNWEEDEDYSGGRGLGILGRAS